MTVTHPDVQRYFMSISKAASLILQSGAVGTGGEIFILHTGEPVRIVTLAETMITLSGLKPYENIDISFTGLRPGGKLTGELYDVEEISSYPGYEKLMVLQRELQSGVIAAVEAFLEELPSLDSRQIKARLAEITPEYRPWDSAMSVVQVPGDITGYGSYGSCLRSNCQPGGVGYPLRPPARWAPDLHNEGGQERRRYSSGCGQTAAVTNIA